MSGIAMIVSLALAVSVWAGEGAAVSDRDALDRSDSIQIAARCATRYEGVFSGVYEDPVSDYRYPITVFECFDSLAACRQWLRPLQSKYDDGPVIAKCRRL